MTAVIRVGGVPEHFNFPWHLALETGAFERTGIAVEYSDYPGGTGAMADALHAQGAIASAPPPTALWHSL